jgi:hypothetical protein
VLCTLGIRQTRNVHREPFDFVGLLTLSLGIGALQFMLDGGELKDWFNSSEIWIEATVSGLGFYLFTVHTVTTDEALVSQPRPVEERQFCRGHPVDVCGGLIMTGTLALLPSDRNWVIFRCLPEPRNRGNNGIVIWDKKHADRQRAVSVLVSVHSGLPREIHRKLGRRLL